MGKRDDRKSDRMIAPLSVDPGAQFVSLYKYQILMKSRKSGDVHKI